MAALWARHRLLLDQVSPAFNRDGQHSVAWLAFDLRRGDLLAMGGACQQTWGHPVPKVAHSEPRKSIPFRVVVPAAAEKVAPVGTVRGEGP